MHVLPRVRLALARHPVVYWAVVGVLALGVVASLLSYQARVRAAADVWGRSRTVWVSTGTVSAGDELIAEPREYPVAMLPGSAVESDPAGAIAAHAVAMGEVITATDLSPIGVTALLPTGWVALAVPAPPDAQPPIGSNVRLFAYGSPLADGLVVALAESHLMIGVAADRAGPVSVALADGIVVLGLVVP